MTVQFFLPDGSGVIFHDVIRKEYRGPFLPGSEVQESISGSLIITRQEFENSFFAISHRIVQLFDSIKLVINEKPGLRFEALLTGELNLVGENDKLNLKAGQYRLTDSHLFTALFKKTTSCSFFIAHYSLELLDQLGISILPSLPQPMSNEMENLIKEILCNPYEEKLRDFHYENCVRELLFFHLLQGKSPMPGELENKDLSAIYRADSIIASNLQKHFTIEKLSRMAGTNQFKLKKGFRQIFGMGVFHRLLFRRMEQAKILLETTNKSIGEIAELTGYDTAAGFIHAFRREFDMTPREWKQKSQNNNKEE